MIRESGLNRCSQGPFAEAAGRDRVVQRFVERELRAYLECGLSPGLETADATDGKP